MLIATYKKTNRDYEIICSGKVKIHNIWLDSVTYQCMESHNYYTKLRSQFNKEFIIKSLEI